ncbi:hypothetical protein LCGC14_2406690 [marine sediment metagenome]|uniref:Uncharacterized protein n=1 Tax=marine sediment metagenome TaxID=412755 RepID=A0A0F9EN63_9ZZZZ
MGWEKQSCDNCGHDATHLYNVTVQMQHSSHTGPVEEHLVCPRCFVGDIAVEMYERIVDKVKL